MRQKQHKLTIIKMDEDVLNERENLCLTAFKEASKFLDNVMAECGIEGGKNMQRYKLVRKIFNDHLNQRIIVSAMSIVGEKHSQEFENFYDSSKRINPKVDQEAVVLAFCLLYPELRGKIFGEMQEFSDNFIENYQSVFREKGREP